MSHLRHSLAAALALGLAACGSEPEPQPWGVAETDLDVVDWIDAEYAAGREPRFANPVDAAAAEYVKLAIALGRVDQGFVDAYHGPQFWDDGIKDVDPDPAFFLDNFKRLRDQLNQIAPQSEADEIRVEQMKKLVRAMQRRVRIVNDDPPTFRVEAAAVYDVRVPDYDLSEYDAVLAEIDALLPGEGTTAERVVAFRDSLAVPEDRLQAVFDRAIEECRTRTQAYYDLPEGERFRMEFVTDKSWSGYNYYQGDYESLIQINTDFPIVIDRAVDLGCHEGYPGHHVWNLFIESELVRERGWLEYSVNPLFSPFGPIAEGSANYGIDLAFPGEEKIAFERDVLFPMAGLDPAKAETLATLMMLKGELSHATNEVARRLLNGEITGEAALPLMQKYYLESEEKTRQRLRFVRTYRAYVINYNIGKDYARDYVEAAGEEPDARWAAFKEMLTRPMTASDIDEALGRE
ncbi:MAG: hypothetical protein AAFR11_11810 [Pseudomonadota bacterium]